MRQCLDMETISIQPSQMNIIFLSLRTYQGINSPHAFQYVWVRKIFFPSSVSSQVFGYPPSMDHAGFIFLVAHVD